jgi:predicted enzyme related to lactoylglutathione lyase
LSTDVQTKVGTFIWHENNSTDVEKAKSFYTELLGWQTEAWPGEQEYTIVKVADKGHGGISNAQGGAPSHWMGNVFVEDVDEVARRTEAAGGKILVGPEDIPEVGRFALISDPQGAVLSAFAPRPQGDGELGEGVFVWDELHTSDPAAAKSFYGEVLGWTAEDSDMGGMTYTVFKNAAGAQVAGCMQTMEGEPEPNWLVYIGADDVDATTARAKELGATVIVEPHDIPNDIGRFSLLQDPAGAVFGLFKPGSAGQ